MSSALRMVANSEFLSMNLKNFTVIPYLLSPFSMTASSSSGVLLDDRCLFKKEFSLQTFAMLSCPALLAWSTQTQRTLQLQHQH